MLGDDVAGVERALLGGGPRAERLPDRHDVIVDGLREADHRQLIAVAAQVCREVGSGAVGVVAADRVQDIDAVAAQLLRSDMQRVLPGLTRPRLTQSSTLVSLTRLLPIGLPPNACRRWAFARTSSVTSTDLPVSRPA